MKFKSKYKFGDKLKNVNSRIKGIVVGIVFYDTGDIDYNIQPRKSKSYWYNEKRLVKV